MDKPKGRQDNSAVLHLFYIMALNADLMDNQNSCQFLESFICRVTLFFVLTGKGCRTICKIVLRQKA